MQRLTITSIPGLGSCNPQQIYCVWLRLVRGMGGVHQRQMHCLSLILFTSFPSSSGPSVPTRHHNTTLSHGVNYKYETMAVENWERLGVLVHLGRDGALLASGSSQDVGTIAPSHSFPHCGGKIMYQRESHSTMPCPSQPPPPPTGPAGPACDQPHGPDTYG